MQYLLLFVLISCTVHLTVAPPVNQKTKDEGEAEHKPDDGETADIMMYRRYLMEVVQALESDPDFRAKLEKANEEYIRTGQIAEELEFVNHNVRTRLDELKREELERLRHLATKENEIKNGLDMDHLKIADHLDHTNTHTFEVQDLKKLIIKTTQDLAKADQRRREEFKQHEMQQKYEEQEKLKSMNEEEKKKYEQELEALKEKHKKHEPVHHPASKQQLEEVWETQDHMETEDFNPKTFFFMHDVDGNGVWDQDEVKALFLKELDKLYAQGASPGDVFKRSEEMERMREHVFNEADLNKDGLISYEEFLEQTKKPEFQRDEGWQSLDEQQIYTQEEYESFQRHKQEEIQKMIAKGMLPPHPDNIPAQHESFPPQYVQVPVAPGVAPISNQNQHAQFQDQTHPQYHQQQQQQQPQVMIPQQQYHNQVPVQQAHAKIPPSQQYHPQYQQQQYHNQVPVQQAHPQIPPSQQYDLQYPGQVPQNQQYQPVPVQQLHSGQVPVQQQAQAPVQQQAQVPVQQQQGQVPENVQNNHVPQHNNPSESNPQASAQQEINRNKIQTAGKA